LTEANRITITIRTTTAAPINAMSTVLVPFGGVP
jgi:hypothetical protein